MNTHASLLSRVKAYAIAHKAISAIIILVVIGGGYVGWKRAFASSTPTRYILATAANKDLVMSVSGSGQVAAVNQLDVTSTVSGTIDRIDVNPGDTVRAGQTIAEIDSADALRAVDNAQLALENAQVAYDKAVKDANDQAATSTVSDLAKAYQTAYNAIVTAAVDMPAMFTGMEDIYYTPSHSPYFSDVNIATQVDQEAAAYKLQAGASLDDAKREYDANFSRYKDINANSSPEEIVSLLNETDLILRKLLAAVSGTYSTLDYIQTKLTTVPAQLTADKSTLSGFVTKINADDSALTSAATGIDDAQSSQTTADLAMKTAQLTVSQDQAALQDAETALADHQIKAPFDGLVAKVSAKEQDVASNGTDIATIVSPNDLVDISLNEIDAAKVAKGDPATLTFDAIDGLTLPGHVSNVDLVGTVSQGVVTYTVEVSFDQTDPRVKPGMTTNATIVTSTKHNALIVPSSAIQTKGNRSFVEELSAKYPEQEASRGVTSATAPRLVPVTVGDSNDTETEIVSGVSAGDQVIVRTIQGSAQTAAPSIFSSFSNKGGAANGAARRATGVMIGG